jgi:hypothetical protein
MVRMVRLELTHLSATASKTVAATNYATSAYLKLVRATGIEPVRITRQILSLLGLPIPPRSHLTIFKEQRQLLDMYVLYTRYSNKSTTFYLSFANLAGPAGIEPTSPSSKHGILSIELRAGDWLRGTDSHRRSSGYEPDELLLLHPAIYGRSTRIRTLDPLVPNQVRYQTALHSELSFERQVMIYYKLFFD